MFESVKRTTDATVEPVSVDDMKEFMRIEPSDDAENALITALISAARQQVETILNRALISQTWTAVSDCLPSRILLDYPPLISVTSIKSYADDNTTTTNSSDNYAVVTTTQPGQVILKPGNVWTTARTYSGYEVIYVAGYGATAADVPAGIVQGIKVLVTKLYHRRGDDINVLINEPDVMGWLASFKAY